MSGKAEDYAGRVFLLMGKEYRISRSIRAQWFFQHINSTVYAKSDEELLSSHEELEVLSVLPEVSHIHGIQSFRLAPSTKITFIGRQYRFVFCLDISPSEATVNVQTGKTLTEEVFYNFMNCIMGLVEPFNVPGSSVVLEPELVVTVLAHMPLAYKICQVIVQGFCVKQENLYDLLYEVRSKLQTLEDYMASEITKNYARRLSCEADARESEEVFMHDPESGLFMMVRDALLALQLLPDNASAGLVIVTDGVFSLSDASVVDAVLAQMRASTVVCSFLQVGSGCQYSANGFGYISHTALMQFIASATSGAYLCSCPKVNTSYPRQQASSEEKEVQPMNIYHDALLCWNFHTDADRGKIESKSATDKLWIKRLPFNKSNQMKSHTLQQSMQRIKHTETNLQTRIASVLSVRLREGYSIENVAITKDGTQLEVTLTLPWKEHVLIEYIAKAAWPLEQINRTTHVDVLIGGSYDFLVDITSKQKFTSIYRKTVVHKFEQTIKSLQSTDELLVRLQLFSVNPAYTTIPDSAKDGVPLFHLPQNSKTPVLSMQHGRSKKSAKSQEAQFAEFWKPILHLDTKTWQKWFHCHRVSFLLENDRPISKNLFLLSSSGHYQSVHCRTALNTLNRMLRDWSSFVLLENHSYIRFLGRSNQRSPYSFCLLRLVFKGLCVVIRLAFLGGTAGTERHRIVSELKNSLRALKAPLKKPLFSPEHALADSPPKSVILTTKEKHCVLFLEKPLERILIKYDSVPEELRFIETRPGEGEGNLDTTQSSSRLTPVATLTGGSPARSTAILGALSCYMYNQRWVWKMSCNGKSLSNSAVSGVLYALTKRRLLEGFHFCSSANGIITMAKEVPMKYSCYNGGFSEDVCVIQFVLFPPHQCVQMKDAVNDESIEGDLYKESRGELQIATEIWIEPQCGTAYANKGKLHFLHGLTYNEFPKKIFGSDFDTVKDLVTYAHLESMCNDSLLVSVPSSSATVIEPSSDWFSNSSIVEVPFLFDIISLLRKSRQIFMLLPLLKNEEKDEMTQEQSPNNTLLSLLFSSLSELNDCEVPLRPEDSEAFSQFVQQRCEQQVKSDVTNAHSISFPEGDSLQPSWKCFAGCTRNALFIVLLPASVDDVEKIQHLTGCKEEDHVNENVSHDAKDDTDLQKTEGSIKIPEHCSQAVEGRSQNDSSPNLDTNSQRTDKSMDDIDGKPRQTCLPIFIYECRCSVISDIQPKNEESQNIFLDYTSKFCDHVSQSEADIRNQTEETFREIENSASLSSFCKSLTERFFQTFVNSVFRNLQLGYNLTSKDVESSIEMICEESHLEVDITRFIRILCMHYRNETLDDEVFGCNIEGNVVVRRGGKLSSASTVRTPRTPTSATVRCRSESIHRFVQESFSEILRKKFSPVPQNNDLFFYQSGDDQQFDKEEHEQGSISEAESEVDESEMQGIGAIYESAAQFAEIREAMHEDVEYSDNMSDLSRISVQGSTCAVSEFESITNILSDVGNSIASDIDEESQPHPLFLHLTCSLRNKNQISDTALLPVNTLPTCLGEIIGLLENDSRFDPHSSSLRVTLDLNCLILPPEMESTKHWKVSDEATPNYAASDIDEEFLVEETGGMQDDQLRQGVFEYRTEKAVMSSQQGENVSTLIDNAITDPLKSLPKSQLIAIKLIVKKIEWLLRDEIASALRDCTPITEITLDNVADHVRNSKTENCQFRRIPLRFVSGMDKSLQLFLDELVEARIDGYYLENQGKYYYLASEKGLTKEEEKSKDCDAEKAENTKTMRVDDEGEGTVRDDIIKANDSSKKEDYSMDGDAEKAVMTGVENEDIEDLERVRHDLIQANGKSKDDSGCDAENTSTMQIENEIAAEVGKSPDASISNDETDDIRLVRDDTMEATDEKRECGKEADTRMDETDCKATNEDASPGIPTDTQPEPETGETVSVKPNQVQSTDRDSMLEAEIQTLKSDAFQRDEDSLLDSGSQKMGDVQRDEISSIENDPCSVDVSDSTSLPETPSEEKIPQNESSTEFLNKDIRSNDPTNENLDDIENKSVNESDTENNSQSYDGPRVDHRTGDSESTSSNIEPRPINAEAQSTIGEFCEGIISDIIGLALVNHSDENHIDCCRSRKGSLPLPFKEDVFIRRRYSDPGIHVTTNEQYDRTMSFKMEGLTPDSKQLSLQDRCGKSDPDFWLFASIVGTEVMVFFHKRREVNESRALHSENCYINLLRIIDDIGRVVNQKMLLDDLNETFTCHNLLVAEEDEQIWSRRETKPLFVSGASEMGMPYGNVVHGEFEFKPGFFECEKVWETYLPVHYRLKRSPGQPMGTSRAIQAVRMVLDRFAVLNRSNLFVYRESSGNVFYFRINEESETAPLAPVVRSNEEEHMKEDNFSYQSATSSSWSLAYKPQMEAAQEQHDDHEIKDASDVVLQRTGSIVAQNEKDSLSELSFAGSSMVASVQKIHFCVHGICDPGYEIRDELVRVLSNKLDDAVFEQLNLLIARNPKCRLAPADVQFIQPPGQPPASVICIALPRRSMPYVHPLMFYLRQNLLHRFHTPRFTEISPEFHFKNYTGKISTFASAETLSLNDVYLYNRRGKKGNGIGCIHLSLINSEHKELVVDAALQRVRDEILEPKLYMSYLKDLINVSSVSEIKTSNPEDIFLKFKVWERGSIGIEELRSLLLTDVRRALCDVYLEYYLLATPLCEVPAHLHCHYAPRHHPSNPNSSSVTSPLTKNASNSTTPVSSTPFSFAPRSSSRFLSEPATPSERRSRSPGVLLRKRSLNDFAPKEPLSRTSSRDSPKELVKKPQQDTTESTEKTYETLEGFFPLNKSGSLDVESPAPRYSDSDNASMKDSDLVSSEAGSIPAVNPNNILPDFIGSEDQPQLGSSYDTVTDREVEESFNAMLHAGIDDVANVDKKDMTWQEIEHRRRKDKEARKLRRQYERGEIGSLHPCFHSGLEDVLREVINEGSLAVHRHKGSFKCRYSPELIMKEVLRIISEIFPNATAKVFKKSSMSSTLHQEDKNSTLFVPFSFDRYAVKSDSLGESSTDSISTGYPVSLIPGCQVSFIAIGRNVKQWRKSIFSNEVISDEEEKSTTSSSMSKQQYKPLCPEGHTPGNRTSDFMAPSYIKPAFVPRQKFYIIKFTNKEIITHFYNFPVEVNVILDKQLTRLYAWFNARMHLSSCMAMQKLGLFHHLHFTDDEFFDEETKGFCSSTNHPHITSLVKETAPPSREKHKVANSDITKSLNFQMPELDETLRDTAPSQPLHVAGYKSLNDPVRRVGYQYQRAKLKEILDIWHNCGPHFPVYENRLHLLKRYSHFIHFCQTPLLFNTCSKANDKNSPVEEKKDVEEKVKEESKESPSKNSRLNFNEETHDWYGELKWTVMQKYIQYLQTLGFCNVHLQPSAKSQQVKSQKSVFKRVPSKSSSESTGRNRPAIQYLQKSVNAGILLLELSYRADNLFLKMFAFEASRVMTLERCITVQENWLFLEDCNKYKDLMHLHSFSYDLHLRQAQQFLSGRNMIFYPGYPVQKLLQSMMKEFPKPPSFSCCYLAQGTVSIPCTSELDTTEVYKYFTINAERYKMNPAKITRIEDSQIKTSETIDQTILSYMYYTSRTQDNGEFQKMTSSFRRDSADFDGNVVITLSPSQDNEVLNLTFFLVLTNRREFYPRRTLKSKISSLRGHRKRTLSSSPKAGRASESSDEMQFNGSTKPRVRFSARTKSSSYTEAQDPSDSQTGPLKVPTWPGTLPDVDQSGSPSPKEISSPSSDTALLTAKKISQLPTYAPHEQSRRLHHTTSDELFMRRSNSNDSIKTSTVAPHMFRKSSSFGQLSDSYEVADVNFLSNEVAFVSDRLSKVASTCLSNCWRDFIWYQLLLMDNADEETAARKQRRRAERRESFYEFSLQKWKLEKTLKSIRKITTPKISLSEMKLLLALVKVYSISEIDQNLATVLALMGNSRPQKNAGALKVLSSKFGNTYREFYSEEQRMRYICVLNPEDLDMFVLVHTDLEGTVMDVKAVYREQPSILPSASSSYANLSDKEKASVKHVENVISCVSFNIWTQLLPSQ